MQPARIAYFCQYAPHGVEVISFQLHDRSHKALPLFEVVQLIM